MKKARFALLAALSTALVVTAAASAAGGGGGSGKLLAEVRQATVQFHDPGAAVAAGYTATEECTALPDLGGMGYHYVNFAAFAEPAIDAARPEILLYAPQPDGTPRLVGVEYAAVDADQDLTTDGDRPSLLGVPFDGPMEGHEPGMPIHYDLHVWLWQANPAGTFAQFNSNVSC